MLAIWSTWCLPCQEPLSRRRRGREILRRAAGAATERLRLGRTRATSAASVMAERGLSYQVLEHGEVLALDYKVRCPPALFVIDGDGRLILVQKPRHSCRPPELARSVESAIRSALP